MTEAEDKNKDYLTIIKQVEKQTKTKILDDDKQVLPDVLKKAKDVALVEWTDFDDVKNRLLGLFESTGDERDTMTPEAIHQVSHMNGIEVSKTKIGRLLNNSFASPFARP